MPKSNKKRKFSVYARHPGRRATHVIEEVSLEAAAIAFLEDFPLPADDEDHKLTVIVRDLTESSEHCFTVDLDTGETQPCG